MRFKDICVYGFNYLGGLNYLRKRNNLPTILFWHGVEKDNLLHQSVELESIPESIFVKQLKYLKKYFEVISLDEFYYRYITSSFKGRELVITFDDGYRNNLTCAAPILYELKLPFTVFISTEHIETNERFPASIPRLVLLGGQLDSIDVPSIKYRRQMSNDEDRLSVAFDLEERIKKFSHDVVKEICFELQSNISRNDYLSLLERFPAGTPMSWNEVEELSGIGATIGSHCMDHFICHENQTNEEIYLQLKNSKNIIEDKIKKTCDYFAYPNGGFTDISNQYVSELGYKMGFSAKRFDYRTMNNVSSCFPRQNTTKEYQKFKILTSYKNGTL